MQCWSGQTHARSTHQSLVAPRIWWSAMPPLFHFTRCVCVCTCLHVCVCVCVCVCVSADMSVFHPSCLLQCQKRPITVSKETYYSVCGYVCLSSILSISLSTYARAHELASTRRCESASLSLSLSVSLCVCVTHTRV